MTEDIPSHPEQNLTHRPTRIGAEIVRLRSSAGRSQQVFGELSGISKSEIDKIERGIRIPSAVTIANICLSLDIPTHDPRMDILLLAANYDRIDKNPKRIYLTPIDSDTLNRYKKLRFPKGTRTGNILYTLISSSNLTTIDVGKISGISKHTLQKIYEGKRLPSAIIVIKLCGALGIPNSDPLVRDLLLNADYERISNNSTINKTQATKNIDTDHIRTGEQLVLEADLSKGHQEFRRILSSLRRERKLSIEDLANSAGISKSALKKAEDGERVPSAFVISNICRALDIAESDPIMNLLLLTADYKRIENARSTVSFIPADDASEQRFKNLVFFVGTKSKDIITTLRHIRGYTQIGLAKRAETSRSMVEQAELGLIIPSARTLANFCRILGISYKSPLMNALLLAANYDRIRAQIQ